MKLLLATTCFLWSAVSFAAIGGVEMLEGEVTIVNQGVARPAQVAVWSKKAT
jgi:hypothetical protein